MRRFAVMAVVLTVVGLLFSGRATMQTDHARIAEQFFRGVYGGDPSVVDKLASEDVAISYPVFEKLFQKHGIRGRDAVRDFGAGFAERWTDQQITIDDRVSEGDKVVLVWSFQAKNASSGEEHAWGGMSLFRFDENGKVESEMGLESTPGPVERFALIDADE